MLKVVSIFISKFQSNEIERKTINFADTNCRLKSQRNCGRTENQINGMSAYFYFRVLFSRRNRLKTVPSK